MKKVYIPLILILTFLICFSCKKSAAEVVEEAPAETQKTEITEPESTEPVIEKEETQPEETIVEQPKEKISETVFKEVEDLLAKAKEALADIYDKENFLNAKKNLNDAKNLNETDPDKAAELLDLARKQAEDAYHNAYKARALEKKQEADRLISDLKAGGIEVSNKEEFDNAMNPYNEGTTFFDEENYPSSYAKYAESVDKLKELSAVQKKMRQESESKIKYIQSLIRKAEKLGAATYAADELGSAKDNLNNGIQQYKDFSFDDSKASLEQAEKDAIAAIDKTNKALAEKKRLEALKAIRKAGKSLERAAGKETLKNGKAQKSLDYKFEFEEDVEINEGNAPKNESSVEEMSLSSYQKILERAVDYIEKAKEAYHKADYDMAIKYAEIAQRIADSYSGVGIKTYYTVKLNPQRRDCLWRISEYAYIYNNPFYWPMIWKTNKEDILNPDLIFPGQTFAIPELD
jgi:nucleoid-associated protein YgaU